MATFDEIFGEYKPPKASRNAMNRYFDKVFGEYEPSEQKPEDNGGLLDTVANYAGFGALNFAALPTFLAGLGFELAGKGFNAVAETFPQDSWRRALLEGARDSAQTTSNVATGALDALAPNTDAESIPGAFANAHTSGLLGSYGSLAKMFHADTTADRLHQTSQTRANQSPVPAELSWKYFTNPRGLASDFGQLTGSMAAIMPAMALAPETAVARGVAALGGDAITQALINRGLYNAAKVFATGAPRALQYGLTSAPIEGLMEGGETRREALEQGVSDEEATRRSINTALANVPTLMLTNTLEGAMLTSPLLKAARRGKLFAGAQIAGRAALNSAQEQAEEAWQQGIQNWQAGRPYGILPQDWTPDQWEAASRVRYPAAIIGGAGGAYQAVRPDTNTQNFDRGSDENVSNADYAARANQAGINQHIKNRYELSGHHATYRNWAKNISGGQMSDEVFNSIVRNAQNYGVPVDLALALATAESNGIQDDTSEAGAIGVMQLMPETAQSLGVDPYDTEQNIRGGIKYLKQQLDAFNGDWKLAAAAYNAGPGAVQKAGGIPNYSETQNYVARIGGFLEQFQSNGNRSDETRAQPQSGERGAGEGSENLFGVENYDMPTQGDNITAQVSQLKSGWQKIIPQIGGVLKNKFGINATISSAARSAEHNAEVGGVPTSHHIIREDGGDALDIVFDRQTTQEEQDNIADYFRSTGLFSEVLYHDVGSGAHLHLGGLRTENLSRKSSAAPSRQSSPQPQQNQQPPQVDIDDETTKNLFARFAEDRRNASTGEQAAEDELFFAPMFKGDTFQNTAENRAAILDSYGDEFRAWVNAQQEQPAQPQSPKPKTDQTSPYLNNEPVIAAAKKFLEQLTAKSDPKSLDTLINLQSAIASGDVSTVENILRQNQQPQSTQEPVQNNTPPENILPQPTTPTTSQPTQQTSENSRPATQEQGKTKQEPLQEQPVQETLSELKAREPLYYDKQQDAVRNPPAKGNNYKAQNARERQGETLAYVASVMGIDLPTELISAMTNRGSIRDIELAQSLILNTGKFPDRPTPIKPKRINEYFRIPFGYSDEHEISVEGPIAAKFGEQLRLLANKYNGHVSSYDGTSVNLLRFYRESDRSNFVSEATKVISQHIAQSAQETQSANDDRFAFDLLPNVDELNDVEIDDAQPQRAATTSQPTTPAEIRGNTAEVITGSRTPHQIQYRVVEADALTSSHTIDNGGVFANENYPRELQPRERTRADMQAQLIAMSENLNPADLLDARDVNQGAPTTRADGVVLNGNGRVAAIRRAYEIGRGTAYKNALVENAQRLGLNADEISKMTRPVLVREVAGDLTAEQVRDITGTQTGGAKMGASEQAKIDAEKISSATLAQFPQSDNVDLSSADAADFLRAAIADIATADERNALTTADGKISQDGINRVKRALFALAYGDDGLISRMSESTDDNVRGATNALLAAAPTIAKIRAAMANGTAHRYNLNTIAEAVKKLSALRDEGKTVANFLQEQSLFADQKFNDEAREILTTLDRNKCAPKKIAAFLKKLAQLIRNQGDPREANLFGGETQPAPLLDLIKRARQEVENSGMDNILEQETNQDAQSQETSQKPRNKKSAALHAKLKTDTHPKLKTWLAAKLAEAATPEGKQARAYLESLAKKNLTDEQLDNAEAHLQRREGDTPKALNFDPIREESASESPKTAIFRRNGKDLLDLHVGFGAIREAPAGTKVRVTYKSFFGNSRYEKYYIVGEGGIQQVNENGQPIGQPYAFNKSPFSFVQGLRPADVEGRKAFEEIFGSRTPQEIKLTYPQTTNQNAQTRQTAPKAESKATVKAKIAKILNDAKDEAYKILKADKYPEIKDWVDKKFRLMRGQVAVVDVASAEFLAKRFMQEMKRHEARSAEIAANEMFEQWQNRHRDELNIDNLGTPSYRKANATFAAADKIISQMIHGALEPEKAYAELKRCLADDAAPKPKGKWRTVMSSPSREELQKFMRKEFGNDTLTIRDDGTVFDEAHGRNSNYVVRTKNGRWQLGKYEDDSESAPKPKPEPKAKPQAKSDANESISAMNSALREASEKIINDAAKNPDVARALEQLGATVKNGKVTYPDDKTFQACVNLVNAIQNGKILAWHGAKADFDVFSNEAAFSGYGEMEHGWGLYFSASPNIAEIYRRVALGLGEFSSITNNVFNVRGKNVTAKEVADSLIEEIPSDKKIKLSSLERLAIAFLDSFHATTVEEATERAKFEIQRQMNMFPNDTESERKALELIEKGEVKIIKCSPPTQLPKGEGRIYTVAIPNESEMLDEQQDFSEQSPKVHRALEEISKIIGLKFNGMNGKQIYDVIATEHFKKGKINQQVSQYMKLLRF